MFDDQALSPIIHDEVTDICSAFVKLNDQRSLSSSSASIDNGENTAFLTRG